MSIHEQKYTTLTFKRINLKHFQIRHVYKNYFIKPKENIKQFLKNKTSLYLHLINMDAGEIGKYQH